MPQKNYDAILRDHHQCGLYHRPRQGLSEIMDTAEEAGLFVIRIDLGPASDPCSFLERLDTALGFPDNFGDDWDALANCLVDLGWLEADGFLLVLERCDPFLAASPDGFTTALQILDSASQAWCERGIPFWVFVDLQDESLPFLLKWQ